MKNLFCKQNKKAWGWMLLFCSMLWCRTLVAQGLSDEHVHDTLGENLFVAFGYNDFVLDLATNNDLSEKDAYAFLYLIRDKRQDHIKIMDWAAEGIVHIEDIDSLKNVFTNIYINELAWFKQQNSDELFEFPATEAKIDPCFNNDFEANSFDTWKGYTAGACGKGVPCGVTAGLNVQRHVVVNKSDVDPYVPSLSPVKFGNFAVRLENFYNGGDAAVLRKTFPVTNANNIFTYHYAAVLEDPLNHRLEESPYFQVKMFDESGNEIPCAYYYVVAKPPIDNFEYIQTNSLIKNNRIRSMQLYYRDWTSVSVPLLNYVGQNVTIEFVVSDCSRGGHLGYVYVDSDCFSLNELTPQRMCGKNDIEMKIVDGFAAYQWSGANIIGRTDSSVVRVNSVGTYQVTLTPKSDNPCPITTSFEVIEACLPSVVNTEICEDEYNTQKNDTIDLDNYEDLITSYSSNQGKVLGWYTDYPTAGAVPISNPNRVTISDGDILYALISYKFFIDTGTIVFNTNILPNLSGYSHVPVCTSSTVDLDMSTLLSPSGGQLFVNNKLASPLLKIYPDSIYKGKYLTSTTKGCKDSLDFEIKNYLQPAIQIGNDTVICKTELLHFETEIKKDSYAYKWKNNAGNVISTLPFVNVLPTTSDVLTLEVSTANNCNIAETVAITMLNKPTVTLTPPHCLYANSSQLIARLSDTLGTVPYFFSWKKGSKSLANQNDTVLSVSDAGIYKVKVDYLNCYTELASEVYQVPKIKVMPVEVPCINEDVVFNTEVSMDNTVVDWYDQNGLSLLRNSSSLRLNVVDTVSGFVVTTSDKGCSDTTTYGIGTIPYPDFYIKDTVVCANESVVINSYFNNTSNGYQTNYQWYLNDSKLENTQTAYAANIPGKYVLAVTYESCTSTDTMTLTHLPIPVVSLPAYKHICTDNEETVSLEANVGRYAYLEWRPLNDTTRIVEVNQPGVYEVWVRNEINCWNADTVNVLNICPPRVFAPNAFSPDNDGINDFFVVEGANVGKFQLLIFNRWGEIIFESTDLKQSWDGIYRDEEMPSGVFPWIITYEGDNDSYQGPFKLEGSVTLIR